jgi:hypothetical protein
MFMQHGRDSSVWRSLATAFGDGLAFGVGMKLTQNVVRRAEAPASVPTPVAAPAAASRIDEMEQRMARIEQSSPAGFNRKVMEAVVTALDARLKEHAGQVERRLTDLEARVALEMNALRQQDHALVGGIQTRMDAFEARLLERIAEARRGFDEELAGLTAQRQEFAARAREFMEAEAAAQVAQAMQALRGETAIAIAAGVAREVPRAVAAQMGPLESQLRQSARAAAEAAVAGQTGALQGALAAQTREVEGLRLQVAENRSASVDMLLAVAQVCRETAERISVQPSAPTPAPEPEPVPPVESAPELPAPIGPASETNGRAAYPLDEGIALAAPTFGQVQTSTRPWRVPLVSSFLLMAVSAALLRIV